ncbi:hypothetical protein [Vibrio sp. 10N.286.49.B3]|uniref:hypothetical protein n=1 Tax=Vibrio sp. 10N.286.49.B3 TaxID=1880855 RepID=UPI0018E4ACBF|nr:hypothetical protein [Vibrio sp. 10N.286.49.B3]
MRPTTVRFSYSNRGASRRRSSFVAAPVAKNATPVMTKTEKELRLTTTPNKEVQAA